MPERGQVAPDPVSCNDSPAFDAYPCAGDAGGTPHPNPDFCTACGPGLPRFAYRDAGVVVFDQPLPTSLVDQYAQLPSPGQADALPNKTPIEFVGYGVSVQARTPRQSAAAAAALLPMGSWSYKPTGVRAGPPALPGSIRPNTTLVMRPRDP